MNGVSYSRRMKCYVCHHCSTGYCETLDHLVWHIDQEHPEKSPRTD